MARHPLPLPLDKEAQEKQPEEEVGRRQNRDPQETTGETGIVIWTWPRRTCRRAFHLQGDLSDRALLRSHLLRRPGSLRACPRWHPLRHRAHRSPRQRKWWSALRAARPGPTRWRLPQSRSRIPLGLNMSGNRQWRHHCPHPTTLRSRWPTRRRLRPTLRYHR